MNNFVYKIDKRLARNLSHKYEKNKHYVKSYSNI